MGTHMRVLSKSFSMNTNMTGFKWISKKHCILVLRMKVASALEGLNYNHILFWNQFISEVDQNFT